MIAVIWEFYFYISWHLRRERVRMVARLHKAKSRPRIRLTKKKALIISGKHESSPNRVLYISLKCFGTSLFNKNKKVFGKVFIFLTTL